MLVGPLAIAARSLLLSRALKCSPSLALYAPSCLISRSVWKGRAVQAALPSACIPPLLLRPPLPLVRPLPDPPLGQTRAWSQQWTDKKRGKFKKRGGRTRPANGRRDTAPKHAPPRRYLLLTTHPKDALLKYPVSSSCLLPAPLPKNTNTPLRLCWGQKKGGTEARMEGAVPNRPSLHVPPVNQPPCPRLAALIAHRYIAHLVRSPTHTHANT